MRKPIPSIAGPLAPLVLLLFVGCAGLSGTNVGEPTPHVRHLFHEKLSLLHVGMPVDSLEMLFEKADEPGEAGILHRARVVTADFQRLRYSLGWKSDPRHQIGYKDIEEIDVEIATVLVEGPHLVAIELHE